MVRSYMSHGRAWVDEDTNLGRAQQKWSDFLAGPPSFISCDTETISLKDRTLSGVGIAVSPNDAFYLSTDEPEFEHLLNVLRDPIVAKAWFNAPFDLRVMRPQQIDTLNTHDVAILSRLAGYGGTLEDVSFWVDAWAQSMSVVMKQHGVSRTDRLGDHDTYGVASDILADKCSMDCIATYRLYEFLLPKVDRAYYEVERAMLPTLEQVSSVGINLDQQRQQELQEHYSREVSYFRALCAAEGFEPSKNFEVGYTLTERGAWLPLTEGKTMLATDEHTLQKVKAPRAIPVAQLVLNYRRNHKVLSTYVAPLEGLERAHGYMHMDAVTGRINISGFGSNNPDRNTANIPKRMDASKPPHLRCRSMYIADEGDDEVTIADANQVEMRVLAYMSRDEVMLGAYAAKADIHTITEKSLWSTVGPNRVAAKVFNYAMVYGADPFTVAEYIENSNVAEVARQMETWLGTYPGVARWMKSQVKEGLRDGYVTSLMGRRMQVPFEKGEKHAANCCVNYPIQATAAEIFKRTILVCQATLGSHRNYVHDELLMTGRQVMPTGVADITEVHVPMDVEYKERWG